MAVGKFRCVVMNVTDLERGERFWSAVTGLPVIFSGVGHPTKYSGLGETAHHSILLQQPTKEPLHPMSAGGPGARVAWSAIPVGVMT
jgi:catechol 2,3-dioxygenase-like lactoylglutathione lyase family enzyme